jgi:hypothetical protein
VQSSPIQSSPVQCNSMQRYMVVHRSGSCGVHGRWSKIATKGSPNWETRLTTKHVPRCVFPQQIAACVFQTTPDQTQDQTPDQTQDQTPDRTPDRTPEIVQANITMPDQIMPEHQRAHHRRAAQHALNRLLATPNDRTLNPPKHVLYPKKNT